MLSDIEIRVVTARKEAAKSAMRFFSEIKDIRSPNNPAAGVTKTKQADFYKLRETCDVAVLSMFEDATREGLGNCHEKAAIALSSLTSNPRLIGNTIVTMCQSIGYDHVFLVLADRTVGYDQNLADFERTMMIFDAWTEDWYFPHLDKLTKTIYSLRKKTSNPWHISVNWQKEVRRNIAAHKFKFNSISAGVKPRLGDTIPAIQKTRF